MVEFYRYVAAAVCELVDEFEPGSVPALGFCYAFLEKVIEDEWGILDGYGIVAKLLVEVVGVEPGECRVMLDRDA